MARGNSNGSEIYLGNEICQSEQQDVEGEGEGITQDP